MSPFDEVAGLAPLAIWDGVVAWAVHGERSTLSVIELAPRCAVPEHLHENEQLGLLLRGSLSFRIADESRELGPGATWRILSGVPHEVAAGPEGALVIESFAPGRADWDRFERLEPRPTPW